MSGRVYIKRKEFCLRNGSPVKIRRSRAAVTDAEPGGIHCESGKDFALDGIGSQKTPQQKRAWLSRDWTGMRKSFGRCALPRMVLFRLPGFGLLCSVSFAI